MPFITSLPTEYIRKNKLDEKAGFKMDTIMFATGAPMNEALAADLWDVGSMGAAAVTGVANYDMMIIGEEMCIRDSAKEIWPLKRPRSGARARLAGLFLCMRSKNGLYSL